MTKIKTNVVVTTEKTTTEAIQVGSQAEVRRITRVRTTNGKSTTSVTETVAFTGKTKEPNFGEFALVPPELTEKLRLTGWFRDDEDYGQISKKPFTDVVNDEPYTAVRIKNYDHTLYDAEGNCLPVGMHFSYIDGNVANNAFYLNGLVDHLKTRDDVTLLQERLAEEGKYIQDIEHYNRTAGRNRYVAFIWHPDVETYRRFRSELSGGDHWHRYDLAHTYMGNDKFRKPHKAHDDFDE